jgi:type I restriction enzyme S subunit
MTAGSVLSWSDALITDVADVTLGKTPKRADYTSNGSHRVLKYRDIQKNRLALNETKDGFARDDLELLRSLREVSIGDVLIGASGHSSESIGRKVAIVRELPPGGPHYFAGELLRIRPNREKLDSRWAQYFFSSEEGFRRLQDAVSGVHLTNGRARQMSIPLPPLAAQQHICDLLDAADKSSSSAQTCLSAARRLVRRFRESVLAAACSGRLTADWRDHNGGEVSVDLTSTVELGDVGALEVPQNWVVASVKDIATVQLGGTPSRKRPDYWNGGIRWVSSGEVANCRITSTRETISESGLEHSSAKLYPRGTVLIAMIGEGKTRGQAAILDIDAATNQNAAGILVDRRFVDPEYLWRWALSEYETTRAVGRGGNQPALNRQKVAELVLPIPPLDEQVEIVRRVETLSELADGLQARIDNASKRVDRGSQAVLAKAFRGDLLSADGGGVAA